MGNTVARVEVEFNNCLNGLPFQVDACIDWDALVVHPLFHACHDLMLVGINSFSMRGVDICPYVL